MLFGLSLFAEFIANDKPILVNYRGEILHADLQLLPRDRVRRRFPDRGGLPRPRGEMPDHHRRAGGLFRRPRRHHRTTRQTAMVDGAAISRRAGCSGRRSPIRTTPSPISTAPRPSAAGRRPPAGHRRHHARRGGAGDLRLPAVDPVHHHRHRASPRCIGIVAGAVQGYFGGWLDLIFQRFIEIWTSTPVALHHHHHVRDPRAQFLAAGVPDRAVRLARAGRRGARRIPAGAQLRIRPRRQGAGRVEPRRSCSATCCPTPWSPR